MVGWSGKSREFAVDAGRFKPKELKVYGVGPCKIVDILQLT